MLNLYDKKFPIRSLIDRLYPGRAIREHSVKEVMFQIKDGSTLLVPTDKTVVYVGYVTWTLGASRVFMYRSGDAIELDFEKNNTRVPVAFDNFTVEDDTQAPLAWQFIGWQATIDGSTDPVENTPIPVVAMMPTGGAMIAFYPQGFIAPDGTPFQLNSDPNNRLIVGVLLKTAGTTTDVRVVIRDGASVQLSDSGSQTIPIGTDEFKGFQCDISQADLAAASTVVCQVLFGSVWTDVMSCAVPASGGWGYRDLSGMITSTQNVGTPAAATQLLQVTQGSNQTKFDVATKFGSETSPKYRPGNVFSYSMAADFSGGVAMVPATSLTNNVQSVFGTHTAANPLVTQDITGVVSGEDWWLSLDSELTSTGGTQTNLSTLILETLGDVYYAAKNIYSAP